MRFRSRWLAGAGVILLGAAVVLVPSRARGWQYRLTGSQAAFNVVVSRSVPKGGTLGRLEAAVGRGERVEAPAWLRKEAARDPKRFPDGLRDGDFWVTYGFPGNSRWYFQVRDGRLVTYDPAVLAGQPQERVAVIR